MKTDSLGSTLLKCLGVGIALSAVTAAALYVQHYTSGDEKIKDIGKIYGESESLTEIPESDTIIADPSFFLGQNYDRKIDIAKFGCFYSYLTNDLRILRLFYDFIIITNPRVRKEDLVDFESFRENFEVLKQNINKSQSRIDDKNVALIMSLCVLNKNVTSKFKKIDETDLNLIKLLVKSCYKTIRAKQPDFNLLIRDSSIIKEKIFNDFGNIPIAFTSIYKGTKEIEYYKDLCNRSLSAPDEGLTYHIYQRTKEIIRESTSILKEIVECFKKPPEKIKDLISFLEKTNKDGCKLLSKFNFIKSPTLKHLSEITMKYGVDDFQLFHKVSGMEKFKKTLISLCYCWECCFQLKNSESDKKLNLLEKLNHLRDSLEKKSEKSKDISEKEYSKIEIFHMKSGKNVEFEEKDKKIKYSNGKTSDSFTYSIYKKIIEPIVNNILDEKTLQKAHIPDFAQLPSDKQQQILHSMGGSDQERLSIFRKNNPDYLAKALKTYGERSNEISDAELLRYQGNSDTCWAVTTQALLFINGIFLHIREIHNLSSGYLSNISGSISGDIEQIKNSLELIKDRLSELDINSKLKELSPVVFQFNLDDLEKEGNLIEKLKNALVSASPNGIAIMDPSGLGHVVFILKIENDKVYYESWGFQFVVPLDFFVNSIIFISKVNHIKKCVYEDKRFSDENLKKNKRNNVELFVQELIDVSQTEKMQKLLFKEAKKKLNFIIKNDTKIESSNHKELNRFLQLNDIEPFFVENTPNYKEPTKHEKKTSKMWRTEKNPCPRVKMLVFANQSELGGVERPGKINFNASSN